MFKVNVDLIFVPSWIRLADEIHNLHQLMQDNFQMSEQDLQVRVETCKSVAALLPKAIEDLTNIALAEHIAEGHIKVVMDPLRNGK